MSKSSVSLGQTLEVLLSGRPYLMGSTTLSKNDSERVANALALWLLVLKDTGSWCGLERVYSDANLQRSASQLVGCDIEVEMEVLDFLLCQLRCYNPLMGRTGFKAFKAFFQPPSGRSTCFCCVWPLLTYFYRSDCKPSVFGFLNTVLQFFKRLTLKDVDGLEESSIAKYLALEEEMGTWSYDDHTVLELNRIITKWFMGYMPEGHPFHSSGATAEVRRGRGSAAKFLASKSTPKLEMLGALTGFGEHPLIDRGSIRDSCKYQLVPKGINKKRGISMEVTANQYWQHSVAGSLDLWISSHKEMKIDLHDQDKSRSMCLKGSRTLRYGTIDLSDASDTVTWELVTLLFAETRLLTILSLCRTEQVEIDGKLIKLNKAYPMGSAACFTIECVVFASIAALACEHVGCTPDFRVYGDDIVIPAEAYSECLRILELLNFKVNEEKSYGPQSPFLEACGVEAYFGVDVTPYRLSRRYDIVALRGKSPEALEGSLSLVNRIVPYALKSTRKYMIQSILANYKLVPFSVNPREGIYHPDPGNTHLPTKWDRDTQTLLYRCVCVVSKSDPGPSVIRYIETLEGMESRSEPEVALSFAPEPISSGPTRTHLRTKWVRLWG